MTIEYPIAFSVGELTFVGGIPRAIIEAEYTVVIRGALSWDDYVYQESVTEGHPCRHEVPASNPFVVDQTYEWRVRLKDGDGFWSCPSEGAGVFIQAGSLGRYCFDCARIVTDADLAEGKFGEQETDTSSVVLTVGAFSGGVSPVQLHRATIASDNIITEALLGTFNLQHSATSNGTIALDYKVQGSRVYILYVTNLGSQGSEVIFCYVNIPTPTVVADSMLVIPASSGVKLSSNVGLVSTSVGFTGFVMELTGVSVMHSYLLRQGAWSGLAYPIEDEEFVWEYQTYWTLENHTLIAFREHSEAFIVYGVQQAGDDIVVYRFNTEFGSLLKTLIPNPNPATLGSHPVFAEFLPGESVIRVLAAHYTPGVGAEVLSLALTCADLTLLSQQVIPYANQVAGDDPQPYISTLQGLGNSRVLMTRSVVDLDHMEIEIFQYTPGEGLLLPVDDCRKTLMEFEPGVTAAASVGDLSLAANLDLRFASGNKIFTPLVTDPAAGDYHLNGDYVKGSLVDFTEALPALTHREYGAEIGTTSGTGLDSVGLQGDPLNDTLVLTITEAAALTGLKVSATFDRASASVWASSAWIYIQELGYSFPLVLGDETGAWPISVADEGVSVGAEFGMGLDVDDTLTFELCQSKDVVPGAADITYSSISITAYKSDLLEGCDTETAIDLFTTAQVYDSDPFPNPCNPPMESAPSSLAESESVFQTRTCSSGDCAQIFTIGGGQISFADSFGWATMTVVLDSDVDVDFSNVASVIYQILSGPEENTSVEISWEDSAGLSEGDEGYDMTAIRQFRLECIIGQMGGGTIVIGPITGSAEGA